MKLLITGCGCSGTLWTFRMLAAAGYKVGHENAVSCKGVDEQKLEKQDTEVSWLIPAFIEKINENYNGEIWFQSRHPLKIAYSFKRQNWFSRKGTHFKCVTDTIGKEFLDSSHVELSYVIEWFNLIKQFSCKHYRIEDINDLSLLDDIDNVTGKTVVRNDEAINKTLSLTNINSTGPAGIYNPNEFDRLNELKDICEEYGYSL